MNRLEKTFTRLRKNNEKALVGFLTAGDPNPKLSFEIILSMVESGLDILEIGIPFSDPTADGPVIQRSSARALEHQVTANQVIEMTRKLREVSEIPVILFTYYNPIHAMGTDTFVSRAVEAGADGLLIVDLPLEESRELTDCQKADELSLIRLVAPTTSQSRMKKIAEAGAGFLYLISKTGVTGSQGLDTSETRKTAKILRSLTDLPICTGFGISTPDDVREVAQFSDGVVIGSAFEYIIETNLESKELPTIMGSATLTFKAATRLLPGK